MLKPTCCQCDHIAYILTPSKPIERSNAVPACWCESSRRSSRGIRHTITSRRYFTVRLLLGKYPLRGCSLGYWVNYQSNSMPCSRSTYALMPVKECTDGGPETMQQRNMCDLCVPQAHKAVPASACWMVCVLGGAPRLSPATPFRGLQHTVDKFIIFHS